jgi:hypothetical protein
VTRTHNTRSQKANPMRNATAVAPDNPELAMLPASKIQVMDATSQGGGMAVAVPASQIVGPSKSSELSDGYTSMTLALTSDGIACQEREGIMPPTGLGLGIKEEGQEGSPTSGAKTTGMSMPTRLA